MSTVPYRVSPDIEPAFSAGLRTILIERNALASLGEAMKTTPLGSAFGRSCELIVRGNGRVVVSGIGKSGLVARKIAATLASTGTPAFFIHPTDASHGDLGMITEGDIVLILSWSGETAEVGDIVSYCRQFHIPLIAMTSQERSALAERCEMCLLLPTVAEACPNRLAPTSSTAMQMALGDALAVALIELRGFSASDFKRYHPRGKLGAQLLTVGQVMASGDAVPSLEPTATILEATVEMTRKRFGITAIVDDDGLLTGAFTDGDLRRSIASSALTEVVADHMTLSPAWIAPDMLVSQAIETMNTRNILQLFVCIERRLVGIIHMHDALRTGVL